MKKNYIMAFVLGGILPILGGLLLSINHFLRKKEETKSDAECGSKIGEGETNPAFDGTESQLKSDFVSSRFFFVICIALRSII